MPDKPRVLLVDDDPSQRDLIAGQLRAAGYPVTTACQGEEALGSLEKEPIDILVSDIQMPGLGGLDLLRMLREKYPMILISGGLTEATCQEALAQGAAAVLAKPVALADLMRAVDGAYRLAEGG